jgi:hypothetical protein
MDALVMAGSQVDQREAAGRGRLEDPHGHAARRSQVRHRGHLLRHESRAAAAQRQHPVVRPGLLGVDQPARRSGGAKLLDGVLQIMSETPPF